MLIFARLNDDVRRLVNAEELLKLLHSHFDPHVNAHAHVHAHKRAIGNSWKIERFFGNESLQETIRLFHYRYSPDTVAHS